MSQPDEWLPCQVIRYLGNNQCVIRLVQTGAVVPISLINDLDRTLARRLHPLRVVEGTVKMGRYDREWFRDCELHVKWDTFKGERFPPQERHTRKRKHGSAAPG